jgi:hypothetical protein
MLFYYEAISVTVPIRGSYSFTSISSLDTYGYLYVNAFNSSNLSNNLRTENNDGDNSTFQFQIKYVLDPTITYILVVTTYEPGTTGAFSIMAVGPARVTYCCITNMSTPLCE